MWLTINLGSSSDCDPYDEIIMMKFLYCSLPWHFMSHKIFLINLYFVICIICNKYIATRHRGPCKLDFVYEIAHVLSRKHRHRWCKYCLLPPKMPEAPSIQNGCKAIVEAQHSVRAELHTVCKGCCSRPSCITTSRLVTSPLCWEKHSYHLSHNWRIATYCFSRTALR